MKKNSNQLPVIDKTYDFHESLTTGTVFNLEALPTALDIC